MGKPPAVVMIARHGARLDAVDKQWHLTSPTPYDPPLTYGGWTQSRALGARIASLLQAREEAANDSPSHSRNGSAGVGKTSDIAGPAPDNDTGSKPTREQRRKYRVIIHTSPFLRCLQTGIAISAGISQYRRAPAASKPLHSGSPVTRTSDGGFSPGLSAISEPAGGTNGPAANKEKENQNPGPNRSNPKTLLRVDAFLGEWLSPDYYEQIMPPPSSVMMVAGAKADLLRRGEDIPRGHDTHSKSISGYFPGGWGHSSNSVSPEGEEDGRPRYMSAMSFALGQRHRAGSYDGPSTPASLGRGILPRLSTDVNAESSDGYVPPIPAYAVSPSEPIPAGYVTHARDACVDVDYQWDSMREPLNWGDGGEYGEEWSSMHMRFRNGLQRMIDWYRTHECLIPWRHRHNRENQSDSESAVYDDNDDDDFADTVLVLVTHGAGCNALIGALTNQPVLLDVGMASLTMAVRKDTAVDAETSQTGQQVNHGPRKAHRRTSSIVVPIPQEYDLKLVASTEHLRAASNPLSIPQLTSPKVAASQPISSYRHRLGSRSSGPNDFFTIGDSATRSYGSQRASSTESRQFPLNRGASGLWGSASTSDGASESGDDIVPNFEDPKPVPCDKAPSEDRTNTPKASEQTSMKRMPERTKSQRGLWGSVTIAQEPEPSLKRRWTVTDRRS